MTIIAFFKEAHPAERLTISLFAAGLLLPFVCLAIKITGIPIHYSDGERSGVVVKLSKKGVFWKTWEGEMNMGSMERGHDDSSIPSRWQFSVSDERVVRDIQDASRRGQRITLYYTEPLVLPLSRGSSGYIVTRAAINQ